MVIHLGAIDGSFGGNPLFRKIIIGIGVTGTGFDRAWRLAAIIVSIPGGISDLAEFRI